MLGNDKIEVVCGKGSKLCLLFSTLWIILSSYKKLLVEPTSYIFGNTNWILQCLLLNREKNKLPKVKVPIHLSLTSETVYTLTTNAVGMMDFKRFKEGKSSQIRWMDCVRMLWKKRLPFLWLITCRLANADPSNFSTQSMGETICYLNNFKQAYLFNKSDEKRTRFRILILY